MTAAQKDLAREKAAAEKEKEAAARKEELAKERARAAGPSGVELDSLISQGGGGHSDSELL